MPITLKCPHCSKRLRVKDHLAGKTAPCPACKKPLVIPVPVDVESVAAEALADGPQTTKVEEQQQQPTKVAKTIDFTCPFCDAGLHLPAEMGGKKEPCPECKRILNVPKLIEDRPKDWRTVEAKAGPSAAAKAPEPQLQGAWGTAQKSRVSTEALEEADAIVEEDEPIGWGVWIKRIVLAGGLAGLVVLAVVLFTRHQSAQAQTDAIDEALKLVEGKADQKLDMPSALRAEIFRAAGEFHIGKNEPDKAVKLFKQARGQFLRKADKSVPLDQELMLTRLALSVVDLGGEKQQIDDDQRLAWDKVQEQVFHTLGGIASPEIKAQAVREVSAKLLKKQQALLAVGLVLRFRGDEASPVQAQWIACLNDKSLPLDEKARGEMLKLAAKKFPAPNPAAKIDNPVLRTGYAEAMARQDQWDEAMKFVKADGPTSDRLQAALVVCACTQEKNPAKARDVLEYALAAGKDAGSPWLKLQLVRAAVAAGQLTKAEEIARALPADFKNWAFLEIFRSKLEQTQGEAEDSLVPQTEMAKDSLPHALAWEELAAHNIRHSAAIRSRLESGDANLRPFLLSGIALGSQAAAPVPGRDTK